MSILPKNELKEIVKNPKMFLIWGQSMSGKTYLARQFPNPIILNTDGNGTKIPEPSIEIKTFETFVQALEEIEKGLDSLGLSTLNYEFVEEQIIEFKEKGELSIWKDDNFRKLSRRITDILGVRAKVENIVVTAMDNEELT